MEGISVRGKAGLTEPSCSPTILSLLNVRLLLLLMQHLHWTLKIVQLMTINSHHLWEACGLPNKWRPNPMISLYDSLLSVIPLTSMKGWRHP